MLVEQSDHLRDGTHGTTLKRDKAYLALYQEIARLRLAPGALLDEAALCEQFGLGRTPIREALHQLAGEGLVTIYPRRGVVVTPISVLDARQQTDARLIWEPNIMRLAAKTGTAKHWDALEAVLADAPAAIETEDDVARASDVDFRFHHGIAAVTDNRYIIELHQRFSRIRARLPFLFFRYGLYQPVTDQHYTILARLRDGEQEEAARLVEEHIELTRAREARIDS